jgi:hypothetical protein
MFISFLSLIFIISSAVFLPIFLSFLVHFFLISIFSRLFSLLLPSLPFSSHFFLFLFNPLFLHFHIFSLVFILFLLCPCLSLSLSLRLPLPISSFLAFFHFTNHIYSIF